MSIYPPDRYYRPIDVDLPGDPKPAKKTRADKRTDEAIRERLMGKRVQIICERRFSGDEDNRHPIVPFVELRDRKEARVPERSSELPFTRDGRIVAVYAARDPERAEILSDVIVRFDQPVEGATFARLQYWHQHTTIEPRRRRSWPSFRGNAIVKFLPDRSQRYKRSIDVDLGPAAPGLIPKFDRNDLAKRLTGKRVVIIPGWFRDTGEYFANEDGAVKVLLADSVTHPTLRLQSVDGELRGTIHTVTPTSSPRELFCFVKLDEPIFPNGPRATAPWRYVRLSFSLFNDRGRDRVQGKWSPNEWTANDYYTVFFAPPSAQRPPKYHRRIEIDGIEG